MKIHLQTSTLGARRANRIARVTGAATLALSLVAAAAGALPGMAGHSTAPPDSTHTRLPTMVPLPPAPATPADLSKARKAREFTFVVRHRVFHDFGEQIVARLGESFPIGDTEYSAIVDRYVPDFAMDIKTGRVLSRTAEANNPAIRIVLKEKGVVQDTTWALLDMPPHFGRKSMLAFQMLKIEFVSGKPMVSKQAVVAGGKGR